MIHPSTLAAWLGWAVLALPDGGAAATVSIAAVADTSIFEGNPDANLGGTTLLAGSNQQYSRGRALFRFDLGEIPASAVISDVQVMLYVTRRPDPDQHGGPVDSDFSLYRVFVNWGEGSGSDSTGSVAMAGDATWNERHSGAISWATPGGLIGVDYANTPSATTSISGVGTYVWGSSTELVDDVQSWLVTPAANYGYMLISQSEGLSGSGRRFGSNEQPGGLIPPAQLMVTYTIPEPSVPAMVMIGWAGVALTRRRRG